VSSTSPYTSSWRCDDAHGRGALVPREPRQLQLGQASLPGDAVHDPHLRGSPGHGAQEPLAPGAGLFDVPRAHEGQERERRVAQPAIAVVPVAHPAGLLGERGRRGRHDPAGGRVGEGLERDERAQHRVTPRALVGAARRPVRPEPLGLRDGVRGVDARRRRKMRRRPRQVERHALALGHGEARHAREPLAVYRDAADEPQLIGTRDGAQRPVHLLHPRDDRSVVETNHELHAHRDTPPAAFDDAHEVGLTAAQRHAVEHGNRAVLSLVVGLQDQRPLAVAAAHRGGRPFGGQPPATVLGRAQKGREAGRRVEARQAQPVDRAVTPDQGGGLAVPEERVVFKT
jgi:hypothetical protein